MLASTLVVAGSAASNSNAPGIIPTTQFTPVTSQVLTTPQAVKASDGRSHVADELVLTNATAFEVDLDTVEVRDADTSQVVLSLTGARLSTQLNPIGTSAEAGSAADDPIPSSGTAVVWLDVVVPSWSAVPRQVDHRVAGTIATPAGARPDQHPPKPPTIPPIEDTVGNHVIIKVSDGVYLLYAHMKPGSIVVHVGQRVKVGQQIGLIGTTGNSTTPHLHFQVLTTPTFFPADSTPYVFDKFELVGHET